MSKAGYVLIGLGFAAALLTIWFGRENVFIIATVGISILLGSLLLLTSFGVRLYRGDVRIRLWDAAKMAMVLFSIVLGLRLLLSNWVFTDSDREIGEHIFSSALFAIVFSVYTTAYRRIT